MSDHSVWNRVFVLGADMEKDLPSGKYTFVEGDRNGYIGGETRIHAAQMLLWKGLVKEMFVVAGPTKDGASKAHMMAELIGCGAIPLECGTANTGGNFDVIKAHYDEIGGPEDDARDGILTHLYHLPRVWLLARQYGLEHLFPVPAEGVLAVFGHPNAGTDLLALLTAKCGNALYAERILSEARGCVEMQAREAEKQQLRR
ncbi:MAG: hypothetical protein HYY92_02585 [Parcubacteria group bacterium]|nr:hypothetical protein [Parcubacteria group bacterium]